MCLTSLQVAGMSSSCRVRGGGRAVYLEAHERIRNGSKLANHVHRLLGGGIDDPLDQGSVHQKRGIRLGAGLSAEPGLMRSVEFDFRAAEAKGPRQFFQDIEIIKRVEGA